MFCLSIVTTPWSCLTHTTLLYVQYFRNILHSSIKSSLSMLFVLILYEHMLALIWRHVNEEFYWILQKIVHTCFDALSSVKESEKRRGPKFGTRGAKFHTYGLQSEDQDCNVEAKWWGKDPFWGHDDSHLNPSGRKGYFKRKK